MIKVTVNVESGSPDNYQLFYSRNSSFREKDSVFMQYNGNGAQSLKFGIHDKSIKSIRLDLGSHPGKIIINAIIIQSSNQKMVWSGKHLKELFGIVHDVNSFEAEKNQVIIESQGGDPYIVCSKIQDYFRFDRTKNLICRLLVVVGFFFLFMIELVAGVGVVLRKMNAFFSNKCFRIPRIVYLVNSSKYGKWICFAVVFFCLIFFVIANKSIKFAGDSETYWFLGKTFLHNGKFSLYNYNCPIRGYAFPLINYCIQYFSEKIAVDAIFLFRCLNAALFAITLTVLFPRVYELLTGIKIGVFKVLLFSGIFLYFWGSTILFPLTDFISIASVMGGMFFALKTKSQSRCVGLLWLFAGSFIALSFILRPAYQIVLIPFYLYLVYKGKVLGFTNSRIVKNLIFSLVGMMIIVGPQMGINYHIWGEINPFVPTKYGWVGYRGQHPSVDLYLSQLTAGVKNFRFMEGDRHGILIFNKEGFSVDSEESAFGITGFGEYFNLVLRHPLDFLAIYTRHIFVSLDTFTTSPYLDDVKRKTLFSVFNYTLWFFSISFLWIRRSVLFKNIEILFFVFILTLPAVLAIPVMTECRFFLPVFILMYSIFSFNFDVAKIKDKKAQLVKDYMIPYIAFISVCLFISSTITPRLIN
ncbi:MAG TPA: hypothetical protein VF810_04960 [Patescibacteria group bacterium]